MRSLRRAVVAVAIAALAAPAVAQADAVDDWSIHATAAILTSGRRPTSRRSAGRWCKARSTTRSTPSTAVTSRTCSTSRAGDPSTRRARRSPTAAHRVLVAIVPPAQIAGARRRLRGVARDDPGRVQPKPRDRRRRGRRGGDARGTAWRRALRAVHVRDRYRAGRLAADDAHRARPRRVGRQPRPFLIQSPSQFRSDGPNALTSRAYTQDFNEVKELGSLTSTTRTADQTDRGHLLAGAAGGAVEPPVPRRSPRRTSGHRRGSPASRHGQPRRRRRRDRLLERQVLLELLAAAWRRSARPTPTGTPPRSPIRTGSRSSTLRRRQPAARHAAVP